MAKNMGVVDRVVRAVFAVVVVILYLTGAISGPTAVILGVLAAVLLVTSVIGTCPLYMLFKISTKSSWYGQK